MKTADSADYFDVQMKTVIQKVLKLWSFEVARRNGSHFEKMALKDFMSFCIFSVATWVQSQPNLLFLYHGNALDMLAYAEAPQNIFHWSLCGES